MRVVIIGAGIGGACLAHGLRRHGIEAKLYERNSIQSSGLAGYGIHINLFGQQAMQDCLPDENWRTFLAKSRPVGGQARFYDEHLNLLAAQDGVHLKEGHTVPEQRLSISRTELIDLLVLGLSDQIRWNKQFVRYDSLEDGSIRVHFADGSSVETDVLVGADGSNSKVRKQYLPSIERFNVGVKIVVGRTRLTPKLATHLPASLLDGSPNSIVPTSPDWMFASVWRAPVETTAESPSTVIDSYAVWAYIASEDSYPSTLEELPPAALRDFALSRISGWDRRLLELVGQGELSSVSIVPLHSMPQLPSWATTRVTLLGDSIHNMTPMAGVGANTALRDACVLSRNLSNVATGETVLIEAIADYEQQMRVYANRAVGLSLSNARNAASRSKLKRLFFRTILRIAQRVPVMKSVLFPIGK